MTAEVKPPQAIALPPGIKSQEGLGAIQAFLAMAFADPKAPGKTKSIRWVDAPDGQRWWQLSDVCSALGLANPRKAKTRIPASFVNTVTSSDGIPGNPRKTFINISGVSQLILESRKPEAQPYKAFINGVVVPELAETGGYRPKGLAELATTPAISEALESPASEARPALDLAALAAQLKAAKATATQAGLKGEARIRFALKVVSRGAGFNLEEDFDAARVFGPVPLVAAPEVKVSTVTVDTKQGLTIDELATKLGARPNTVRTWAQNLGLKPEVGPNRQHLYSEGDLERLALAKELLTKGHRALDVRKSVAEAFAPKPPRPEAPPAVENHLNATSIGMLLTPRRSPQEVNQALEVLGLLKRHYPNTPHRGHEWHLTQEGAKAGGRVFQVDKEFGQGVVEQIRWAPSAITALLRTHFEG